MSRTTLLFPLAALLSVLNGCGDALDREYVYVRQEPAVGRSSPTEFVVRIRPDSEAKSVVWVEDARDSQGDLGRTTSTWTGCTFLEADNWECNHPPVSGQRVPERVWMRDGHLHQEYWGEDRAFRTRRRLFGISP